MLKVNIICIGKIKEKYFTDAIAEYSKRLGAFCKFQIIELAEERIKSNAPNQAQIDEVLLAEGKRILQKISPSDYVAAMCIEGKLISSEELSKTLTNAAVIGKTRYKIEHIQQAPYTNPPSTVLSLSQRGLWEGAVEDGL